MDVRGRDSAHFMSCLPERSLRVDIASTPRGDASTTLLLPTLRHIPHDHLRFKSNCIPSSFHLLHLVVGSLQFAHQRIVMMGSWMPPACGPLSGVRWLSSLLLLLSALLLSCADVTAVVATEASSTSASAANRFPPARWSQPLTSLQPWENVLRHNVFLGDRAASDDITLARAVEDEAQSAAGLPVHLPSSSFHGWAPSACAVDEPRNELYIVDDTTGLTVLSASNGTVIRSVPGILGADGLYIMIMRMTVVPASAASPRALVWLSVIATIEDVPSLYLLVLRGDDFSVVRNISQVTPETHGGLSFFATMSLSPEDSSIMYVLSAGYLYTFNTTTGVQLKDGYRGLPEAYGDILVMRRTAAAPTTLFVLYPSAYETESTVLVVSNLNADRLRDVTLQLSNDTELVQQMHVDEQERLWLIDIADNVYCINSTTGAVLITFTTSASNPVASQLSQLIPWYHQFAVSSDGSRVWVTTYGERAITVQSGSGTELASWSCSQAVMLFPMVVQVDDTTQPPTLLYADFLSSLRPAGGSIWRTSSIGAPMQHIDVSPAGDLSFSPWVILVDSRLNRSGAGDMYVFSSSSTSDTDSDSTAYRLNRKGQLLSSFGILYTYNVAWDRSDGGSTYWLVDWAWSSVGRYDTSNSTLLTRFNFTRPAVLDGLAQSCTVTGECTLYIADTYNQQINVVNGTTGQLMRYIDQCHNKESLFGLAVDNHHQLLYAVHCLFAGPILIPYFCFVRVQTTDGTPIADLQAEAAYANPFFRWIALNANGSRLYAADFNNNRVLSWDTSGFQHRSEPLTAPSRRHSRLHQKVSGGE